jgi:uncharacterized protein YbaA (DUF1428 family)
LRGAPGRHTISAPDKRFEPSAEILFDAKRLVYGCFQPIHAMGRKAVI